MAKLKRTWLRVLLGLLVNLLDTLIQIVVTPIAGLLFWIAVLIATLLGPLVVWVAMRPDPKGYRLPRWAQWWDSPLATELMRPWAEFEWEHRLSYERARYLYLAFLMPAEGLRTPRRAHESVRTGKFSAPPA